MKYKVGDKVRVRRDLKNDVSYGSRYAVEGMMDYKGNVVTISEVRPNYYKIEEDDERWDWTDEMLEGLVKDELTAEEAIILRAEMCANNYCNECRAGKRNNGEGIDCCEFSQKYPERVIEILKQWKKEPNRFQRMSVTHPKCYEICMNLENNGVKYKDALETCGIGTETWEQMGQMDIFDFIGGIKIAH